MKRIRLMRPTVTPIFKNSLKGECTTCGDNRSVTALFEDRYDAWISGKYLSKAYNPQPKGFSKNIFTAINQIKKRPYTDSGCQIINRISKSPARTYNVIIAFNLNRLFNNNHTNPQITVAKMALLACRRINIIKLKKNAAYPKILIDCLWNKQKGNKVTK